MKILSEGKRAPFQLCGTSLLAGLFLLLSSIAPATAAPSARVVASRTSGPAPLAVFFDATTTTDSDSSLNAFRDLGYRFEFSDPTAGTWLHSGLSKNQQIGGPLAAHVFEQPGTYTVQLTAKSPGGASSTATVTITVQAANSAFAGDNTVCLSRTSDFSGCPSDAQRIANASSYPQISSGHRYLLHAGQDFSSLGDLNLRWPLQDVQVGSFGSGSKPIVGRLSLTAGDPPQTRYLNRIVVQGLSPTNIDNQVSARDLLLFRNTLNRGGMINIAGAFGWYLQRSTVSGWTNPENIFIIENEIDRNYNETVVTNPNGITGNATRFAIMGNTIDRTNEHNMRIWQASKLFVAHNSASGRSSDSVRHVLKIHSGGLNPVATTLTPGVNDGQRTSQVVVADNKIGSTNSNINWLIATGPQNDHSIEGVENVIIEDNKFAHGTNYIVDYASRAGRNLTTRGNQSSGQSGSNDEARSSGALPGDWYGPNFFGRPSVKNMFSGSSVVPRSPSALVVE